MAIHRGRGENPHCHLVISERSNDGLERTAETWFKRYNGKAPEQGGARKVSTSSKEWLTSTREAWAEHANRALARAGSRERIDHRSLSDRAEEAREAGDLEQAAELGREPGKHLGPGAAIEAKFQMGEREVRSSAVAEAGEIEDRNDRWASGWESVNRELSRVQEELGQLLEELRGGGACHPGDGQKGRRPGASGVRSPADWRADSGGLPAKPRAAAGAGESQGGVAQEARGPEHVPVR